MGTKGWLIVAFVGLVFISTASVTAEENGEGTVTMLMNDLGVLMVVVGVIAALVVSVRNRQ